MLSGGGDVIVLDAGGTHIRIGHIRNETRSTEFDIVSSQILRVDDAREKLLSLINGYCEKNTLTLKAAVLGLPGMLDRVEDVISHCNNIPQLQGRGLKRFLSKALACTVLFEQDTMLQLLGEWRAGAAVNNESVFGVYFGTGIGSAFLLDGNPNNPMGQDIQAGHIPIMADGRLCKCGNTDCVVAYASGHTLLELAKQANCPVEQVFTNGKEVTQKSPLAKDLNQFIQYQSYLLATISTLCKPALVVIGGGIPMMPGYPREQLIENTIDHLQQPYNAQATQFAWASLGASAALHGAQALLDIHEKALS